MRFDKFQVAECQGYVKLHKRKLKTDLEAVRERFGTLLDNGAEAIRSETGGQGITIDAGGVVVHRNSSGREVGWGQSIREGL